jgi:tetratricopeptide (TPR) repeat protein
MKPKSAFTVLLALALSGGLLWAFPTLWMGLILTLLGLVAIQTTVIRRSLTVVRAGQGAPALRMSRAFEGPVATPAFMNQDGTSAKPALDPAAFARFRTHLENVEQQRGLKPATETQAAAVASTNPAAPTGGADPGRGDSAVSDHVAVPAKAAATATPLPPTPKVKTTPTYGPQRRVVMPGQKPAPAPKIAAKPAGTAKPETAAEELEVDLFDDLRPNRQGTLPAKDAPPVPPPPDVVGDAMRTEPEATASGESASLLKLAEDAFRRGESDAARAALDQHLALVGAERATSQAHRLHVRISVLMGQPQIALDAFDAMLKAGYALKEDGVTGLVDEMLDGVSPDLGDSLRVSLLLKVLGVFRQAGNRPEMDQVYRVLIQAQERVGDETKLVQFLKNHLDIMKSMGEVSGQLEVIDEIGNRLFKLGQTAEAREYYELGLKLRAEAQAETPATAPKSSTTPQTA